MMDIQSYYENKTGEKAIYRVVGADYHTLRYVRWLESRSDSAIILLKHANCPECDGCGYTVREVGGCDMDGENDTRECIQEQCRWCYERARLLEEYGGAT